MPELRPVPIAISHAPHRRRGVVLLLVLSALVVATIIAYSILAAASLDSQTSLNARGSVQAEMMAENGVSLAMHYLLHPGESPVALVNGAAGDWHYPGQSNIAVGTDSFSVSVLNLSTGRYRIDAIGKSRDADGKVCERRLRVRVLGVGEWLHRGAAHFSRDVKLDPDVRIESTLWVDGRYDGGGVVLGTRHATNWSASPGWGAPLSKPELAVPAFSKLNLVRAVNENTGYYVYDGQRCRVDYILLDSMLLPPVPTLTNPGNVFVYTGSSPLKLGGLAAATFDGTLVVTNANLEISQNWTFTPKARMPALLIAGKTSLNGTAGKMTVNGLYYTGDGFGASTTTSVDPVTVYGSLLCATTSGTDFGSSVNGSLRFFSDAVKGYVPDLTAQGIRYSRLQIEDWQHVN